jgi:periplasmic protein TonB
MSEKNKHKIFTSTDCLSEKILFDYIDGKLSPKEQHFVEKHLLDCELCSDAIEGLQLLKNRSRIDNINKEISKRIDGSESKVFAINYAVIMSIAAAILLLIGGIYFFNHFVSDKLEQRNEVSELKVREEKEKNISQSFEKDSSQEDQTKFKEKITSGKDTKNGVKSLEDKEPLKRSDQLLETENTKDGEGAVTDEVFTAIPAQPVSPDEKYKDLAASGATNQSQTIALDKNISKNDNDLKSTAEESKNEKTVNENGYYATEQSVSKNAENNREAKSQANKKAKQNKEEETQKPSAASVPYAPKSVTQMDADQTTLADSVNIPEEPVYTIVDEMPNFPGGDVELMKYFQKNIDYTTFSATDENMSTIYIQFIVDSKGKASKAKLLKPYNKENEKKIIEVINKMPQWKPGKLNGKPVNVLYNLPIKIHLK